MIMGIRGVHGTIARGCHIEIYFGACHLDERSQRELARPFHNVSHAQSAILICLVL